MSSALLERPVRRKERGDCPERSGGPATLEQLLGRAWDALRSTETTVDCPVCGGQMEPARAGGACADCGARLS